MQLQVVLKMYVGMQGDGYGHNRVIGVFSSEEKAKEAGSHWTEDFWVDDEEGES